MIGPWKIGKTIGKGSSGPSSPPDPCSSSRDTHDLNRPRQDCQTHPNGLVCCHQDRSEACAGQFEDVD